MLARYSTTYICRCGEMADARDLTCINSTIEIQLRAELRYKTKSLGKFFSCRFESGHRHQLFIRVQIRINKLKIYLVANKYIRNWKRLIIIKCRQVSGAAIIDSIIQRSGSSSVARWTHYPKVVSSNLTSATNYTYALDGIQSSD